MKGLIAVLSLLTLVFSLSSQAAPKHKGSSEPPEHRIFETNAVSVTVSVGKDGDTHETYKITDATKVTLDGVPAFARDLKAGMMARIEVSPDHSTALSISAKDAPAHPGKHRLG